MQIFGKMNTGQRQKEETGKNKMSLSTSLAFVYGPKYTFVTGRGGGGVRKGKMHMHLQMFHKLQRSPAASNGEGNGHGLANKRTGQ